MVRRLYTRFVKPISKDTDTAEREIILNFLLVGIFCLSIAAFIITLMAPILSREPSFPSRLFNNFIIILFIVSLYFIARYKQQYKLVATILTLLIAIFGLSIASQWGILDPYSGLLLGLAVVMAGILIGARYSIYITVILAIALACIQQGQASDNLHPNLSWMQAKPAFGDVIGLTVILFVIALVSWLFNRQMELSLKRAQRSERALERQRDLLEIKVEKRARQLEEAQLDKMQQLYRFAELGQLSTALFHDLANHLSTVNLDIEGISSGVQPDIMNRIQQNVGHINDIVRRVRQQIGGKRSAETFDVQGEIKEVVKILETTAKNADVKVTIKTDKSLKPALLYNGDPTRFRQVILNLINNGIEAYPPDHSKKSQAKEVGVALSRQGTRLLISVSDYGAGIKQSSLSKIFNPFYTTKSKGIGIGLFIVKQIVENDFDGTIDAKSDKLEGTVFTVSMPRTYYARAA